MGVYSFDATASTHDDLKRGVTEDASYLAEGGEHWRVDQNKVSAPGGTISWETGQEFSVSLAEHVAANDPDHVLRMVAAHRKLLEMHKPGGDQGDDCLGCCVGMNRWEDLIYDYWPCDTIKLLAGAYGWTDS
jgi:hypothetical protein